VSSSAPEFIKSSVRIRESLNGVEVNSFRVPPRRFFVHEELAYLSLALNVDDKYLVNRINELKLGRKVIDKLYAIRLDTDPWSLNRLELPDLLNNEVDGDVVQRKENIPFSAYMHINGIRNFLKIVAMKYPKYTEVNVTRMAGYMGIVRYIIYFQY
jgi:hypothetical protein